MCIEACTNRWTIPVLTVGYLSAELLHLTQQQTEQTAVLLLSQEMVALPLLHSHSCCMPR